MHRLLLPLVLFTLLVAPAINAIAADDLAAVPSCEFCGMDRTKFAHSRMFVQYSDASTTGTCSLHCMAVELAVHIDKSVIELKVADFNTKELIDAEQAFWTITEGTPGVMTRNAKWAFAEKSAAQTYIARHGGIMVDFDTAIRAAYTDMYEDTRMIREKRKKMKAMKGMKTQ